MAEPTDVELRSWVQSLIADDEGVRTNDERDHVNFARAVLARWGAQPAPAASQKPLTVEQRNAVFDAVKYEGDGCWEADWSDVIDAVEQAHGIKET